MWGPCYGGLWCLPEVVELKLRIGVHLDLVCSSCWEVGTHGAQQLLHNSAALHRILAAKACSCGSPQGGRMVGKVIAKLFARAVAEEAKLRETKLVPQLTDQRRRWILKGLTAGTKALASGGAGQVYGEVVSMLKDVEDGKELEHIRSVIKHGDTNGSDVRLDIQVVQDGARQMAPYPAFIWDWQCRQSYAWVRDHHINILEFNAFFNYIRSVSGKLTCHSVRAMHIFDSRVCSCVVAKGRSSSKSLNRSLRRYAGYALAMDLQLVGLWTLSGWNFCDEGSRGFAPRDGEG